MVLITKYTRQFGVWYVYFLACSCVFSVVFFYLLMSECSVRLLVDLIHTASVTNFFQKILFHISWTAFILRFVGVPTSKVNIILSVLWKIPLYACYIFLYIPLSVPRPNLKNIKSNKLRNELTINLNSQFVIKSSIF